MSNGHSAPVRSWLVRARLAAAAALLASSALPAASLPGGMHQLLPATNAQPPFELAGAQVLAIAVGSDGSAYVAGFFSSINSEPRAGLARFLPDGSLDADYTPDFITGRPATLAVQSDGRLLVAGQLTSYGGVIRNGIFRLLPDGTLDESFVISSGFGSIQCGTTDIRHVIVQADGKIVVVGCISDYNHTPVGNIARLLPDGTLDTTLVTGTGFDQQPWAVVAQADGKLIVAGLFTSYDGAPAPYIARLNVDGSRDTTFDVGSGPNRSIYCLAGLPDGSVLVNGAFDVFNGTPCDGFLRLTTTGAIDPAFPPPHGMPAALAMVPLPDGDIVLGGTFYSWDNSIPGRIARVNSNGTLDTGFQAGAAFDALVNAIGVLPDGTILAGGGFTSFAGAPRSGLGWVNPDGSAGSKPVPLLRQPGSVHTAAATPDGGWVVGGSFDFVDGSPRPGVAFLRADGALDSTRAPAATLEEINRLAVDSAGRVLVCGWDNGGSGGALTHRVVRYETSGALDPTFTSGTFNDHVRVVLPTPDGKTLVSGMFSSVDGVARNRLARLHENGSLDSSYNPDTRADGMLDALARQPDGKIVTGGRFRDQNNNPRLTTIRILPDGTLDSAYSSVGAGQVINAIVIQPDGRIITAATSFTGFFQPYGVIRRFHPDGTWDQTFDDGTLFNASGGFNGSIGALALQPDGKLWVGGDFYYYRGQNTHGLARLHSDGSLDANLAWNSVPPMAASGGRAAFALAQNPAGDLLAAGTWMMSPTFTGRGALAFPASTLANLSIRSTAGVNENTLIVGLAMAGDAPKPVLFRAIGPTLTDFGVPAVMVDPRLDLFLQGEVAPVAGNDNWGGTAPLKNLFTAVGAFPLPDASFDSALEHLLPTGSFTAHVSGNSAGTALAEIYDAGESHLGRQLVNLSARSYAGTGDNVLILGFVVRGSYTRRLLIRGIGPALTTFNVPGALSDPLLLLYRQGDPTPIAQNDSWGGSAAMIDIFSRTQAFALPAGSADAALVAVLPPGIYTAHVRGANGATGVALAEVYLVD